MARQPRFLFTTEIACPAQFRAPFKLHALFVAPSEIRVLRQYELENKKRVPST
jgi:hypothetical protein